MIEKNGSDFKEIVREIEREDFIYAIKHYGCFKIKTTVKDIKKWWEIDEY